MNNFFDSVFSAFQSDITITELLLFSQVLFLSILAAGVGFYIVNTQQLQKAKIDDQKSRQKLDND